MFRRSCLAIAMVVTAGAFLLRSVGAQEIPSPRAFFGFDLGADRKLADWRELTAYFEILAKGSPRVSVDTLGASTRGLPFVLVTVTSPANHERLQEIREIQQKLADPRRVSGEGELETLLHRGRVVVLITHGIHATEVGGSQMAARLLHKLATSQDPKILEILENVILLDIPSLNPDGLQWVVDWYEQWVGTPFEGAPLPWLYHAYTGHDNNRDWYAFTQVETQLTISKVHNVWHPQIVHDIHQMGSNGARIFFPPYIDPYERNVDPALIAGVNQLGAYMAAELISQGKKGVVIHAQYDGFTPARAYQHYHGGVRILSETASARIASPIEVARSQLRGGWGFEADRSSWNFPWPWEGRRWTLGNIVDYMEAGALALLSNAARNRAYWLENFWGIHRRAVEGWETWPAAWVIPKEQNNPSGLAYVLRILTMGAVEVHQAQEDFTVSGRRVSAGSYVIPMRQPYAAFAQTMLEVQEYPDLRQYPGGPPIRPYDVTAHTLGLLMDVEYFPVREPLQVRLSPPIPVQAWDFRPPAGLAGPGAPRVGIYRSWQEPMTEGWTRWTFDQHRLSYDTVRDARIRRGNLGADYDVLLFQDQPAASIRNGFSPGQMPPEYTGGLGEQGVQALREFVEGGGRIVAVERAVDFVVEILGLDVRNAVSGLPPEEFFIPGSLLKVDLVPGHVLTQGKRNTTPVWFWETSRAFEVRDPRVEVVARYASDTLLLSGWALGGERLAGKPALLSARIGRGSVVLFGFQPDYRGQSAGTWPLLFNALAEGR